MRRTATIHARINVEIRSVLLSALLRIVYRIPRYFLHLNPEYTLKLGELYDAIDEEGRGILKRMDRAIGSGQL